jgi:hypothetical protein
MKRFALPAATACAIFVAVPGAQAKVPPEGIHLCGVSACVHLGVEESTLILAGGGDVGRPLREPSPFYVLRWRWSPSAAEQIAYYVPAADAFRWPTASGETATWTRVSATAAAAIDAIAAGLSPHPVAPPDAVTVGTRQASGPETYFRLLQGPTAGVVPVTRWLVVRMRSDPVSPWTDDRSEIRISARGRSRLVLVDGWVHKVPLWVANRARRGLPLSP